MAIHVEFSRASAPTSRYYHRCMDWLNAFVAGFLKGARETPRAYFAPGVAIWRLLREATEAQLRK